MDEVCIENMSDIEIAGIMRRNNHAKFKTLVRMHLSFELDLNTDEFDLPSHEVLYYEKGKLKKWNRLSKKLRSCTSGKTNLNSLEGSSLILDHNFIKQLKLLKMFILLEKNVTQEGIFRKTGSVSRQNDLRNIIQNDKQLDLNSGYSVHDCATVFKSFLADLNEPVLTDAHYPAHCQIAPLCNTQKILTAVPDKKKELHLLSSIQLLLLLLPDENRTLLKDIIEMLHVVISHENTNKMSAENLATLFAPHLICPRDLPPEALHYIAQTMSAIITYMIIKGLVIFEIPARLATDIRAFFLERKRKKTMSPEQTLDESISDMSTVNTIYTFVDREKTAAAHNSNNTETELAQLYAHIQSLPESSKKRRLIKQFNKQNGQGTPLQLVNMNQAKISEATRSAKSIGDSIKKHIFYKGIISRTPKRSSVLLNSQATPNFSTKNPKLRVLFQSPIPNSSPTYNTSVRSLGSSSSSTMFSIKTHPLQKSISSALLLTQSTNLHQNHMTPTTGITSVSAHVSRTTSGCCTTPLKIISDCSIGKISKQVKTALDTKLLYITEDCDPSTPINHNHIDLQSRYKSEPNLSRMFKERVTEETTPISKNRFMTSKLIKGVSMGNLRFPLALDSSRRLGQSALLKQQSDVSDTPEKRKQLRNEHELDDEDEAVYENGKEIYENIAKKAGGSGTQRLSSYRNIDLITSTPSMLLGRRSMSPITKSTQRMPKAMQESIMTPRSRKPVMLTTTLGSSEQNQTFYQSDLSSFREQDEDSFVHRNCSKKRTAEKSLSEEQSVAPSGALSNNFKEYLLSRSVLTASPVDSSFSSQPDDFGSTQGIEDLEKSQLSPSLLYCLDGNQPLELEKTIDTSTYDNKTISLCGNVITRKRTATSDCIENKENYMDNVNSSALNKKLFIKEFEGNPGETSF